MNTDQLPNKNESCSTRAAAPSRDFEAWLTPGRFALLLGGLIFLCFPDVITGAKSFFMGDFGAFGYPLALSHRESFWRGEMPLWNPLNNCGLPFLAQWNTLTLYPLCLVYLLLPLPWSLCLFNLLHLFLAGFGMYFLARRWSGNYAAAAAAGLIFAFNGLSLHALKWPNNIAALGWMPWVILATEKVWCEGGWRRIVVAAAVCAMQMLAGAPEVIMQTWGIFGVLWLARMLKPAHREPMDGKAPSFPGEPTPQLSRLHLLGAFGAVVVLTIALSAGQLLPFLDLLGHSQRSSSFGDSRWAMPATGWANYLVPLFHTKLAHHGTSVQDGQYWIGSYYVGAATVALAVLAVWRVRRRPLWILAFLGTCSLVVSLGDNGLLYAWIKRALPQLGFIRFPIKFVVTATFVFPLLAAFAIASLRTPGGARPIGRRHVTPIAILFVGLMAAIAWFGCGIQSSLSPASAGPPPSLVLNTLVRAVLLVAILGSLIALPAIKNAKLGSLMVVLLLLMFWLDLFTHIPNPNPRVDPFVFKPNIIRPDLAQGSAPPEYEESRAFSTAEAVSSVRFQSLQDPVNDITIRRLALVNDFNLIDHAAKMDGFFSLYLREADAINSALETSTNDLPLLDFLAVSRVSNPSNDVEWLPRQTQMPLLTVGQAAVFADDSTAFENVFAKTFKPRAEVFLPPAARANITATQQVSAKVLSHQFSNQRLSVEVETPSPTMVVMAQAFYHPWQARVDGQSVPLWRANYAYQALQIPAGRHQVTLTYEDSAFHRGTVISLLALLLCCVGYGAEAWRSRRLCAA